MNENRSKAYTVRQATPEDHPALGLLFEASYPTLMKAHYKPSTLKAALPLMTRANPLLLASGTFFLALGPGAVVLGCGGWTPEQPGTGEVEPGLGHIRHFATRPDHAGRGVGRSLYQACERQAKSAGMTRFECFASLNAVGFYSALGFERLEDVTVALGERVTLPGVLMARSI